MEKLDVFHQLKRPAQGTCSRDLLKGTRLKIVILKERGAPSGIRIHNLPSSNLRYLCAKTSALILWQL